jgi:uncharacterized protein YjbI with pentapeptide repeats
MSANQPDPFDIEALEKAVNDSAVRVSAIWVSFLLFGLYLAIAVGGVTHLQLFLGEALKGGAVKLPIVNTDLSVAAFSVVAPALFVIFHVYLLVQLVLLGRTTEAYNEAIERNITSTSDRARVRQRLANTLFAQMFAGSPRERTGLLGKLLRLMALMTLAIIPVLLLLTFQIKFLPYQSGLVMLTHRLLIFVDLMAVLILWRGAIEPQRDIGWRLVGERRVPLFSAIVLVLFSWFFVQFPGEWHASWMRFEREGCSGFILPKLAYFFPDRLSPSVLDMPHDEKLTQIEAAAKAEAQSAGQNERTTYDFQYRNLRCAEFRRANFRRANFTRADLRGADLSDANLQETLLRGAILRGADLDGAQLQGADLSRERGKEQRAALYFWQTSGASLDGASLWGAQLQGARLDGTSWNGADLSETQMEGASLSFAYLDGANLAQAQMQGANLYRAHLRGANLTGVQLDGANLTEVHLEGALLDRASFNLAEIWHSYLWRAKDAKCDEAQVTEPQLDLVFGRMDQDGRSKGRKATAAEEARYADEVVRWLSQRTEQEVRKRFVADAERDDAESVWLACERKALIRSDYEKQHAAYLIELLCPHHDWYVPYALYVNWIGEPVDPRTGIPELSADYMTKKLSSDVRLRAIVRGLLLRRDDKACPGARVLGERAIKRLQSLERTEP